MSLESGEKNNEVKEDQEVERQQEIQQEEAKKMQRQSAGEVSWMTSRIRIRQRKMR